MKFIRLKKKVEFDVVFVASTHNLVEPKRFIVEYTLYTMPGDDDENGTQSAIEQNCAFQKINFLLRDLVDGSLVYDLANRDLVEALMSKYDNNILSLPVVSEISLIEALHSKMNVLAGENSFVDSVELYDVLQEQSYVYVHDDPDDVSYMYLPDAKTLLGEFPYWPECWWSRYDSTTHDNYSESEEEHKEWLKEAERTELAKLAVFPLQDIDDTVIKMFDKETESEGEGELISIDDVKKQIQGKEPWTPTLV